MTDHLLLLAVSVATFASCAPSRDAALMVARDSAGIEIVENSQGASSKVPPRLSLSVEPTLQIGSRGGHETALHRVVGTTRLADGRIVVANAGTGELRAFGPAGEFVDLDGRTIGKAGSWPGTKSVMRVARGDAGRLTIATVLVPFMDTFEAVVLRDEIVVANNQRIRDVRA